VNRPDNWSDALPAYQPDILAKDLDVVFCGINPALSAETDGHNFSNRSNRFWPLLHLAGFTDVRLVPEEERRLLDYGCGITAVVRRATRRADEVASQEFEWARPEFERKIRRYRPRALAFLGKRAFAGMIGMRDLEWGRQPAKLGGAEVWVLPNPSGLNRAFNLTDLAKLYSDLRTAIPRASRRSRTR
jgi:TDG/mug DNA glycosylase family protein